LFLGSRKYNPECSLDPGVKKAMDPGYATLRYPLSTTLPLEVTFHVSVAETHHDHGSGCEPRRTRAQGQLFTILFCMTSVN
jgi:hypothetical protein